MPINKKNALVAAAIAGLMATSTVAMAGSSFPGSDSMNKTHCSMNGCKGAGSCKGKHVCKGQEAATKVVEGALKTQ